MAIVKVTHPMVSVPGKGGKSVHLAPGKHEVPDELAEKLIKRKLAVADTEEEVKKLDAEDESDQEEKKTTSKRQK